MPDATCNTRSDWLGVRSAPLRGALLGLLLERPGHGGDLAQRVRARLGETWRVSRNDVYRLLDQLDKEGLVRTVEQPLPERERGVRVVYEPNECTAAALTEWMETVTPRESVRLGMQAKVAVAREEDALRLLFALQEYERECLALLQLLGVGEAAADGDPGPWEALRLECERDAAGSTLRAEIVWSERTRARIEAHPATRSL